MGTHTVLKWKCTNLANQLSHSRCKFWQATWLQKPYAPIASKSIEPFASAILSLDWFSLRDIMSCFLISLVPKLLFILVSRKSDELPSAVPAIILISLLSHTNWMVISKTYLKIDELTLRLNSLVYIRQLGMPDQRVHVTSRLLAYSLEYTLHAVILSAKNAVPGLWCTWTKMK